MANSKTILYGRQDKNFMWIFSHIDFSVIDVLEIAEYEINIDEETNSTSRLIVNKETNASANDYVIFKKNNKIIYWGIIEQINNSDGQNIYEYICRYITNMFNQNIALEQNINTSTVEEGYYRIVSASNTNCCMAVLNSSVENNALVQVWSINSLKNGIWKIERNGDHYKIKNVNSGLYLDVMNGAYTSPGNTLCQTTNGTDVDFEYNSDKGYYHINFTGKKFNNNQVMVGIDASVSASDGTKMHNWYNDGIEEGQIARQFYLQRTKEPLIWDVGIEDFIKDQIDSNYIYNEDTFVNKTYLSVELKSHTPKDIVIYDVENGIYNLHTYMTNCTQKYNIVYTFDIDLNSENPILKIYIEKKKTDDVGIFDFSNAWQTQTINGMTITNNGDGSYKLTGLTTAETILDYTFDTFNFNTRYTLSLNNDQIIGEDENDCISMYFIDDSDESIKMNVFNSYNEPSYSYINDYDFSTSHCKLKICNNVACQEVLIRPLIIETYNRDTELIDINAMAITNYDEVFDTEIVSKVIVLTSSKTYTLYLKTDRETTTDKEDTNRAAGLTEITYTENYDDARQTALDIIRNNSYNHNISFSMKDVYYPIGTSIKIKTKKGSIYDTYISSVNITDSSFYNYQCGNIRTTLIEKLLKERK